MSEGETVVAERPERSRVLPPGVVAPALAAVVCVALTVLTWWLFVATTAGQQVEDAALTGASKIRGRLAEVAEHALSFVSVPLLVVVLAAAVLIAMLQRRWSIAVSAIVVLAGANVTSQILQEVLQRPEGDVSTIGHNSFPSGHATVAAAIAATALLVLPVRWRPPVAVLGALLAASLGISTMIGTDAHPWHRTSDVIGGFLITATWYFLVEAVLAGIATADGSPRSGGNPPRALVKVPLGILTFLGGLAGALGLGALAATAVRAPITDDAELTIAFAGAAAAVIAVAFGAAAAMLRLRPHHPAAATPATSD